MKKLDKDVQKSVTQVQKLAAYRDEYLSIKQSSPRFERACKVLGISPETVRRHSPELVEKWYDSDFHWSTNYKDVSSALSDAEISSESQAIPINHSNKEPKPAQ
jgi:hypothetical protein